MAVIVHAASFTIGAKGGFQHNAAIKISNGLIRNGHLTLNFSERDVARAGTVLGHRKFGRAAVNHALLDYCRMHQPDLLLLGHTDMIEPATVTEIRNAVPGLRVLQWYVDALFVPEYVARFEAKADVVDATLISTGIAALDGLRKGGRRVGFLPNPVDPSIERGENHLQRDLPYDLFFACRDPIRSVCGKDRDMGAFMTALLDVLPGVRPLLAGLLGRPTLTGAAYQQALESAAIGLNVSRRADWPLYSSDRLAQMIGNGMAVLIQRSTGYDALFSDDEMLFFSSVDELTEKIRDAVAHPERRQLIAGAGYAKYHRLFNERVVARYLMDFAFDRADATRYGWPAGLI
ncbi:MAG TPA: glycosyltransferase [Stellaceae bacterium]